MGELWQGLEEKGRLVGFDMVGVVTAVPSPNLHAYQRWIDAEMHGQMRYLARPDRLARRQDLNHIHRDPIQFPAQPGLWRRRRSAQAWPAI